MPKRFKDGLDTGKNDIGEDKAIREGLNDMDERDRELQEEHSYAEEFEFDDDFGFSEEY